MISVTHLPQQTASGFHMTFSNGWTASVQFHSGSYISDRRRADSKSVDAEVAAWKGDEWHRFTDDGNATVKGWCRADEVADFIHMVRSKPAA